MNKSENREAAWAEYDRSVRKLVPWLWAEWASELNYEDLPAEVVHTAKRIIIDSLACALGALKSEGLPILESTFRQTSNQSSSSIIGTGMRTSTQNALIANSYLIRHLDYNDLGGGGHNSESLGGLLAVGEDEDSSFKDLITALVIAYELGARVIDAVGDPSFTDSGDPFADYMGMHLLAQAGWHIDIRAGLIMPAALGRLMNLDTESMANAIAVSGGHCASLGILDGDEEDLAMARDLRFGFASAQSLLACQLARNGFTGFLRVVEGPGGVRDVLLHGNLITDIMVKMDDWRILDSSFKTVCQNYTTHGSILATIAIVEQNDFRPEDIESIRIRTGARDARHVTYSPTKKYPRNEATATHSLYFANAAAIVSGGRLGPSEISPEYLGNPQVFDLIDKISVDVDSSLPEVTMGGSSEIRLRDGRTLTHSVNLAHGFASDPLTDGEVEAKFLDAASYAGMPPTQSQACLDTIWGANDDWPIRQLIENLQLR